MGKYLVIEVCDSYVSKVTVAETLVKAIDIANVALEEWAEYIGKSLVHENELYGKADVQSQYAWCELSDDKWIANIIQCPEDI